MDDLIENHVELLLIIAISASKRQKTAPIGAKDCHNRAAFRTRRKQNLQAICISSFSLHPSPFGSKCL